MMEKTNAVREISRDMFIASLLMDKNKFSKNKTIEADANSQAVRFGLRSSGRERQIFAVAIVRCEETEENYRNLAGFMSVGEGIFSRKLMCGGIFTKDKLVYLISGNPESIKGRIAASAGELVKSIERNTHIRCVIGISKFKSNLIDCDIAYDEAAFAINYLPDKTGGVYFVEDVVASLELDNSRVSYIITKFDGILKIGDRTEIEKYLNKEFSEENLRTMSRATRDLLYQQMLFCLRKGVHEVSNSAEAERFLAEQLICPISLLNREDIIRLCLEAKEIMTSQRKQNSEIICDGAMHIIETEYDDETLSLVSISERLHVSASYLSAILRKNRGDTFVNLLTSKRMAAAQEYLKCTSMKIMEVAKRCGYSDQHYFSYCFKRYYGISPNKVRKSSDYENPVNEDDGKMLNL